MRRKSDLRENVAYSLKASFAGTLMGAVFTAPAWYGGFSFSMITGVFGVIYIIVFLVNFVIWTIKSRKQTLRKVKITYDSHGMHCDERRLGYISPETIREIASRR